MNDRVQNGLRAEQWLLTFEKAEKRSGSLGSGALRFIRTRSSIRRELKRQSTRSKNGESCTPRVEPTSRTGGGGGSLGKWLREHLGGSSRGGQSEPGPDLPTRPSGNLGDVRGSSAKHHLGRTSSHVSQNLYCSLPREHGRHSHNGGRGRTNHANLSRGQDNDRPRSSAVNYHERFPSAELGSLTRGSPFYGSEGRSVRKRSRDRRRYSLNENHEQGRQRRKSSCFPSIIKHLHEFSMTEHFSQLVTSDILANDLQSSEPLVGRDIENDFNYGSLILDSNYEFGNDIMYDSKGDEEFKDMVGEMKLLDEDEIVAKYWQQAAIVGEKVFPEHFGDEEEDEDVGEEEEEEERVKGEAELELRPSVGTEKSEAEVAEAESDHEFAEIPAEILADREAMISKLRELQQDFPRLRRRNKLLELYAARHLAKIQRRAAPTDPDRPVDEVERAYKRALRGYKLDIDEIIARRSQLESEARGYQERAAAISATERRAFREFADYERGVAVGLIYARTGRRVAERAVNEIIRRQTAYRDVLTRNRLHFALCQHQLQKLNGQLRDLEVLGPGMTTMDYEAQRMTNVGHRDKLDERDRELEKLRARIEEMANSLANAREKKACLAEDVERERTVLDDRRDRTTRVRSEVNALHVTLKSLRRARADKRRQAGLLVARTGLQEMGRTMSQLDAVRSSVERVTSEIRQYLPAGNNRRNDAAGP